MQLFSGNNMWKTDVAPWFKWHWVWMDGWFLGLDEVQSTSRCTLIECMYIFTVILNVLPTFSSCDCFFVDTALTWYCQMFLSFLQMMVSVLQCNAKHTFCFSVLTNCRIILCQNRCFLFIYFVQSALVLYNHVADFSKGLLKECVNPVPTK